jgi:hypothetical protein
MKAPRRRAILTRRNGGGEGGAKPTPGWKGPGLHFANPRPPSVPTTLALTLEEYYAAAALMGLLASQHEEPDQKWACEWSFRMGQNIAAEAMRRRRKGRVR